MTKQVEAVYEKGVLRPLDPLPLKEHQRVRVTVYSAADEDDWRAQEFMEKVASDLACTPTLGEVRRRLSKIPGSLASDFIAEREET